MTVEGSILVLTTDTNHHRYFLNRMLGAGLPVRDCLMESTSIEPPFATGPVYGAQEDKFEHENFFKEERSDLERFLMQETENFNANDSHEKIKSVSPAFGVVFGARRLSPDTIRLFPGGLINVHRGIAQYYRGLDSDLWAIYHKDYGALGVTIHKIDDELDTGEIVCQEYLAPKQGMRCYQLRYYTTLIATELVIVALRKYLSGTLTSAKQEKIGRYYSFMPKDLKKIVARQFDQYCKNLSR